MAEELQTYKNHPISSSAQAKHGGTRPGWDAQGTVFEPLKPMLIRVGREYHPGLTELKRLCSGADLFFASEEEAEAFGLIMCRAWVDGLKVKMPQIHLKGEHYQCLGESIPKSSALWEKLTTAKQIEHVGADGIDHSYVVECSFAEAQALLEVATALCPGAVDDIARDIRRSR